MVCKDVRFARPFRAAPYPSYHPLPLHPMELTNVILGPVVTEKSELLKQERTYALKVANSATKVDVKKALTKFFNVEVKSVRVLRTTTKVREVGPRVITKRKPYKKVFVTLSKNSKNLDLAQFNAA